MHRLPHHPIAASHLNHRRAVEDLQHRPIPLLHHTQPHQHDRPLPDDHHIARKADTSGANRESSGVSPTYRNDCRPPTGTASANCRPRTGTNVSTIYRARTSANDVAFHGQITVKRSRGMITKPVIMPLTCGFL